MAMVSIKGGKYHQIGLDLEYLQQSFSQLSEFEILGKFDGKYYHISGNNGLKKQVTIKADSEWREGRFLISQYLVLNYQEQGIVIIMKFFNDIFYIYFIRNLMAFFGLIAAVAKIVAFFSKKEAAFYLNWSSHETGHLLEEKDKIAAFKKRTSESVALLLNWGKKNEYTPKLSALIDLLSEAYCSNRIIDKEYDHDENICVTDQPLSLALCNVLRNAKRFSVNGRVRIATLSDDKTLVFIIKNRVKEKVSPADQKKMNDPKSNDRSGLKITYAALEVIKGAITNTFTERETIVEIKVPRKIIERKYHNITSEFLKTPVIAIIDDIKRIRESIDRSVKTHGFKTRTFSHIDDFFDAVEKGDYFDCVIVDRYGEEHEDPQAENWDAVEGDFVGSAKSYGFFGPSILVSQSSFAPHKKSGFKLLLSKQDDNDWRKIIDEILSNKR